MKVLNASSDAIADCNEKVQIIKQCVSQDDEE